jgi:intracellular sulfur oxidation DsrE/DsrF family protein
LLYQTFGSSYGTLTGIYFLFILVKKMQNKFICLVFSTLFFVQVNSSYGLEIKPTAGPVFHDFGAVYTFESLDFLPDTTQHLKAIFDVDDKQTDPGQNNGIISSLHRYYNMHVRSGIPQKNIHLAFVLHGNSTKDALLSSVYKGEFNVDNPNTELIKSLAEMGVGVYICGQSMLARGYNKEDLLPEVKVALSAMTVLTVYQMNNYALIKF